MDEVVTLHRPLLVAVEDLPDGVDLLRRKISTEERLHLARPFVGDTNVGAGEACQVETSIQNRQSLASELLFNLGVIDDDGVCRLVEAEAEVGLPEPADDFEDGVRPPVGTYAPWVAAVEGRNLNVLPSMLPGGVEVLAGSLPNAGWIELHEGKDWPAPL